MLFRFTLSNSIEGSQGISDPDGWKEIKIKLERDKDFHSLVEMIEVPLIFYGSNGDVDGGYDYIRNVEDTQGVDAIIEILIEVSDGGDYETFFEGTLALDTIKDIGDAEFYKLECNIVRNDFWSKFVNHRSQKVNLNSTTDLDGGTRAVINDINIYLTSQKLREKFAVSENEAPSIVPFFQNPVPNDTFYAMPAFVNVTIDEIKQRFNYQDQIFRDNTGTPESLLLYTWYINNDGVMSFNNCSVAWSVSQVVSFADKTYRWHLVYGKPENYTDYIFDEILNDTGLGLYAATSTLNTSIQVSRNDEVYLYLEIVVNSSSGESLTFYPYKRVPLGTNEYTVMDVHFDNSTSENTVTDAFLLRDAARSILSKIVSRDNVLYSNYLGDEAPEGCGSHFAVMKGLHIRGYSMADKPMTMSFDEWWRGANPIFNLGLGYETIGGTEYIRIEHKGYFYDDTPILTFSNVDEITRVYDKDSIFKNIEIGYEKWSAESASGVDDPQTKHTYNTRFKIIGKDEKILSGFIAASLAIEQTRRNRIEFGKDWRLDEDIIIIALNNDATPYQPELDENFSSITGLLNSETRYNIRLTPARNFIRWRPYFNGCLQGYADTYKFASGEGNYDMQSTGDSCDSGTLAENQNISLTSDHYHLAEAYEFEYYLSWEDYKTLRANRHQAIEVSNTSANYKTCHIKEMEWDHINSLAKFTVWIKE